ncbi:MAG: PEGA domain-containing protein [Proteobacteria bacterium]|nr:PEGA domain-containing protein [Pseudomonadota bacterium]
MEYLLVRYDRRRTVYVNGKKAGFTNRSLRINAGRHTVDLGEPDNYTPQRKQIDIAGTTPQAPRELDFVRNE